MSTTISKDSPIDDFPITLKNVAHAIHEHVQAPLGLCCHSVLAAATLATQSFVDVERRGSAIPVSNFFVTIADSGERKTSVDQIVNRQLKQWIRDETKNSTSSKKDFKVPLQIINLLTTEGLRDQLTSHAPSIGIFSSEGGSVLGGYATDPTRISAFASTLSTLWDGDELSFVLARKTPVVLYDRRVSMHLMIQNHLKDKILGNEALWDQGLLSRILFVKPESTIGRRFYRSGSIYEDARLKAYEDRIKSIFKPGIQLDNNLSGSIKTKVLKLSPDAHELWVHFYDEIEMKIGPGEEYRRIINFANKLPDISLRLAAVFEYFENEKATEISELSLDKATNVSRFYMNHLLWLLKNIKTQNPDDEYKLMLINWFLRRRHREQWDGASLKPSEVIQRGPNPVRKGKVGLVKKLFVQLENEGKLTQTSNQNEWKVNWDFLGKITT